MNTSQLFVIGKEAVLTTTLLGYWLLTYLLFSTFQDYNMEARAIILLLMCVTFTLWIVSNALHDWYLTDHKLRDNCHGYTSRKHDKGTRYVNDFKHNLQAYVCVKLFNRRTNSKCNHGCDQCERLKMCFFGEERLVTSLKTKETNELMENLKVIIFIFAGSVSIKLPWHTRR